MINVAIEDCNSTLSLIELDSSCSDIRPSQTIRMLDILIERNEFHGQGRILNSRASSCSYLELDDVIIQENLCDGGSCVLLSSSNTLKKIQLLRNYRSSNGSPEWAIFSSPKGSYTNVTNVMSEGNQIRSFHVSSGTLKIRNSHFSNNMAIGDGGVICTRRNSSLILTNSSFSSNEALRGGALFLHGQSHGTILTCSFYNNKAQILGGAIFILENTNGTISSCKFTNNTAYQDGGAILMHQDIKGTISNCNFTNNKASREGGAIHMHDNMNGTISNCNFTNNKASREGGAIHMHDNMNGTISNCNFTNNTASRDGGTMHIVQCNNTMISKSNFINSKADTFGGTILINRCTSGTITNCTFVNGRSELFGGALLVHLDTNGTISNCTFNNNTVGRDGGAMHMFENVNQKIHNCKFINSQADIFGGAILVHRNINGSISNCSFDSNMGGHDAGAMHMHLCHNVWISNCNFTNNTAMNIGGAIQMHQDTNVSVSNCGFMNNTAGRDGGAMCILEHNNGRVVNCNFTNNSVANNGGAIVEKMNSNFSLFGSTFLRNEAEIGGAIYAKESNNGTISNSTFTNNTASSIGGVIYMDKSNNGMISNCSFAINSATLSGGVIYLFASINGSVSSCSFTNNNARSTGGAISNEAMENGTIQVHDFEMFLYSVALSSNNASYGGAVFSKNATIHIANSTFETNIARRSGGAIYMKQSNTTIEHTIMQSNIAHEDCGGLCVYQRSFLDASNLTVQSNSAKNVGGGIGVKKASSILCYSCMILNNTAIRGAGLHVYTDNSKFGVALMQNSRFENNSAQFCGGGLEFNALMSTNIICTPSNITCARVVLLNTHFVGNFANLSGGAIMTTYVGGILIDCEYIERIRSLVNVEILGSLRPIHHEEFCSSWARNQISRNGVGDVVGAYGREIKLSIDPDHEVTLVRNMHDGYTLENVSSGIRLPNINIIVLNEFEEGPAPTLPQSFEARLSSLEGCFIQREYPTKISNGYGNFSEVIGFASPGNYTLQISFNNNVALQVVNLTVNVRECRLGEEPTLERLACQQCDAISYNFNTSKIGGCTQCPSNGNCTGRFIAPKKGYWHKSPCHKNVQECLVEHACSFENRTNALMNFTTNVTDCNTTKSDLEAYNDALCNEGYEGLLCGSCKKSFGLSVRFLCLKCPRTIISLLTIIGLGLYLLAATAFTIKGCLPFNFKAQDDSSISNQSSEDVGPSYRDLNVYIEMVKLPIEAHDLQKEHLNGRPMTNNIQTQTLNTSLLQSKRNKHLEEYELTRWRMTEVLKIMINFLQTTAVASAIDVPWTDELNTLFESSDYTGALTTVAITRPVDCIVSSSSAVTKAIWRMLVSLFVPTIVMGILFAFWGIIAIRNVKGWPYFFKRCMLSAIAVAYISYLGLTRMAVRAFYCIDVYDSIDYSIPSKHKFWAIDTAIRCYGKDHFAIIAIAVIVLTLITISYPLFSAILLSRKNDSLRRRDSWTFETTGFLFRVFKEKFAYWESVVMFRKACLSVIVVFSYPLGCDSQGLLTSALLFFCLYVHLTLRPYREEFHNLNHLESMSILVSGLTFNLGVFFANGRCSEGIRTLLAILIILGNSVFFLVLLFVLFYNSMVYMRVVLQCENIPLPIPPESWNIIKLYLATRFTKRRQSSV
eukprot:g3773.t1